MRNFVTALSLTALMGIAGAALAQDAAPAAPGVQINGAVEVNYTYNFNRPGGDSNQIIFNRRDGEFALNLADLRINKPVTPTSRTGFMVRLVAGEVEEQAISGDDYENVLEAYIRYLLPLGGRDMTVDAGQFVTHVGYETIEVGTSNFFSKSFLFAIPPPFYHGGLRASLPVSPSTTVTGLLVNRYNGVRDRNRDIAPGFQINHALAGGGNIILNGLTSRENFYTPETTEVLPPVETASRQATVVVPEVNVNRQQSILDLIITRPLSATTSVAAEALYRWGKNDADQSYDVWGIAGYGTFTLGNGNVLALRAEYLGMDKEFLGLDDNANLQSYTISFEPGSGILPGLRTIIELRHDRSDERYFFDNDGNQSKKDQTTLTIGQAYSF